MANISSINGNPIVVGTSGISDGSVTDAKLAQEGGILSVVRGNMVEENITDGTPWAIGTINTDTGQNGSSSTRVRTSSFLHANGAYCRVSVDAGYKASARIYSGGNAGTFVRSTEFSTGDFTIDLSDGKYVRLVAAYESDATITSASDVSAHVSAVSSGYTDATLTQEGKAADAKAVGGMLGSVASANLLQNTTFPYKEDLGRISINGRCSLENVHYYTVRPHGAGSLVRTKAGRAMLFFMTEDLAGLEAGVDYTLTFDLTYSMFSKSVSTTRYINAYLYENKNGATITVDQLKAVLSTNANVTAYKGLATVMQADKEVEHEVKDCTFTFSLGEDTTSFVLFVAGSAGNSAVEYAVGNYLRLDDMRLVRGSGAKPWEPSSKDSGNTIISRNAGMFEKLQQLNRPTRTGSRTLGTAPFCLLHFSDIHGDKDCLENIIEFYRHYSSYIDDVLHTGDSVTTYSTDSMDFWANTDGAENILNCIGNHDTRVGSVWTSLNMADSYESYFADYIGNWGASYQQNQTYYYKDYANKGVRLVVLDIMHQTDEQLAWFEGVLDDALSSSYHVIVAAHSRAHWQFDSHETSWDDKMHSPEYSGGYSYGDTSGNSGTSYPSNLADAYATAVDNFIDDGGNFVCWIHGHTHYKMLAQLHTHPRQLDVAVANAGGASYAWTYVWDRSPWTKSMDDFNVLAIDTVSKVLKIAKVGVDYDRYMRHVDTVAYDYGTHELIHAE